jgi:hypothetical protein
MKNNEKTTLIPPTPPKKNYENHKQTTMWFEDGLSSVW